MFNAEKEYGYGVRVSSADGYYVLLDIHRNYFTDKTGNPVLPFTSVGGPPASGWDWGEQATGIGEQPLPYGIKVGWYSIAEDQFWEGEAVLDQAKLEQLKDYVVNDIMYRSQIPFMRSFDFIVNYAPGGLATVWILGEGEQFVMAQFKANKIEKKNWTAFLKGVWPFNNEVVTREQYLNYQLEGIEDKTRYAVLSEKVKTEIKEGKVPGAEPWLRLMNTYPWILTTSDNYLLKDYFTFYTNGEQYFTYQTQDQYQLPSRAVPYRFSVYIENRQTHELERLDIYLDKDEMMAGFEALNTESDHIEPIKLKFDISDDLSKADTYLIRGKRSIEIKKMKADLVELYNF